MIWRGLNSAGEEKSICLQKYGKVGLEVVGAKYRDVGLREERFIRKFHPTSLLENRILLKTVYPVYVENLTQLENVCFI